MIKAEEIINEKKNKNLTDLEVEYFKENKNLNDCVEKLKMETRRYAKRQITWFKRDSEINWIYIDEYNSFEEIYSYAKAVIERGLLYG